jgi:hypothetical protein
MRQHNSFMRRNQIRRVVKCGDMFYQPISLREAIENVNETWYLPAIQRLYDWGFRHSPIQSTISLFRTERIGGRGYPEIFETAKKICTRIIAGHEEDYTKLIEDICPRVEPSLVTIGCHARAALKL